MAPGHNPSRLRRNLEEPDPDSRPCVKGLLHSLRGSRSYLPGRSEGPCSLRGSRSNLPGRSGRLCSLRGSLPGRSERLCSLRGSPTVSSARPLPVPDQRSWRTKTALNDSRPGKEGRDEANNLLSHLHGGLHLLPASGAIHDSQAIPIVLAVGGGSVIVGVTITAIGINMRSMIRRMSIFR